MTYNYFVCVYMRRCHAYTKAVITNNVFQLVYIILFTVLYIHNIKPKPNVANRYVLPFAHTNLLQGSYFHRTISLWNSLPPSITTTTSLSLPLHQIGFIKIPGSKFLMLIRSYVVTYISKKNVLPPRGLVFLQLTM